MNEVTRRYMEDLERTVTEQHAIILELEDDLSSLAEDMRRSMRR